MNKPALLSEQYRGYHIEMVQVAFGDRERWAYMGTKFDTSVVRPTMSELRKQIDVDIMLRSDWVN